MRNFESGKLKVNELDGSPIEIAAVIVWQVVDSAEAVYNVDDYESFVHIQSESALRAMATSYPYDQHEDGQIALRSHAAEISKHLQDELAGASGRRRRAGARRAHQPPRLRAGNRPGDAAAPAGQRDHRRAHADRRRRGRAWSRWRSSELQKNGVVDLDEERKAQPWSATCWWCCAANAARSRSSTPARCTEPAGARPDSDVVAEKKAYPLRINADVLDAMQRWADDELRSLNAQIEYVLRDALRKAGRLPKQDEDKKETK